jgi:formylglycine-generating enzyme required for sulfatase activity
MVHFPACTITIGPDPTDTVHSPAHRVDVPEFWMDRYEVTVAEFTEFLNKGGNDQYYSAWMRIPERCGIIKNGPGKYAVAPGRENYPVVYVTHDAALAYAESVGKTLPTEEMWERAARGLNGRKYPWGNEDISPRRSNYNFYYGGTTPVGSFPEGATPEGLYDMSGNAKEWTNSRFRPYPGGKPFEHRWIAFWYDPVPENPGYWWVNRGGGWTKQESNMESAYRDGQGHMNVGFRCAKTAE